MAHMWTAITRDISASLADCELSYVARTRIDLALARQQHAGYRAALEAAGCRVVELPALEAHPDAVFVEDVAVVLDEVAILTRPGALSRRGEGASVAEVLAGFRTLRAIEPPGTLDGGDVLRLGRALYVGASARSNLAGIEQLRALVADFGYEVHAVPTRDCLHLKSAVTQVSDDTVLVNPDWVDAAEFASWRAIAVDPAEAHAANALRIGDGDEATLLHPACFPRTRERLAAAGIDVVALDVSELQKAEGALTCCSVLVANAG
jgi:dimethylargininase